jgi:aspartyl-tRNA synthetase
LAYAYDIVCNGNEIGGGSIRIHRADVQRRVFDAARHSPRKAAGQVRLLAEAFKYGPAAARRHSPRMGPRLHAARRGDSIREVIAFPKTRGGFDPLTGAPTPITAAQRAEAGIDAKPKAP